MYQNPNNQYNYNPQFDPNMSQMYPNMQLERLIYEVKENRQRINALAKRITRIENFLRIKDTSDLPFEEDMNPSNFSFN